CHCPEWAEFEGDPDIAGTGIIISFIISAASTIICTCIFLMLFRCKGGTKPDTNSFSPIDVFTRNRIGNPVVRFLGQSQWLGIRLTRTKLSLCNLVQLLADTQLVTGIAMLCAAVIRLRHGLISVYHFSMVKNLVWFSSNVHLLTLLVIRADMLVTMKKGERLVHLRHGTWQKRLEARMGRGGDMLAKVVCMLLMAALLLYCSWVSGAEGWEDNYTCPARCALDRPKGGEALRWIKVDFALVIYAYPMACVPLWPWAGRMWLDRIWHRLIDNKTLGTKSIKPWSVRWVFVPLNVVHAWMGPKEKERELDVDGFGQLIPLFLLGLPFCRFFGCTAVSRVSFCDSLEMANRKEHSRHRQRAQAKAVKQFCAAWLMNNHRQEERKQEEQNMPPQGGE
ncbi:hypothetical protein B0H63DRAFT_548994, partial [Podospora didyma]